MDKKKELTTLGELLIVFGEVLIAMGTPDNASRTECLEKNMIALTSVLVAMSAAQEGTDLEEEIVII